MNAFGGCFIKEPGPLRSLNAAVASATIFRVPGDLSTGLGFVHIVTEYRSFTYIWVKALTPLEYRVGEACRRYGPQWYTLCRWTNNDFVRSARDVR